MVEKLPAGWYVELRGDSVDLDDWVYTLNEPFDPVALKQDDGVYLLSSGEFAEASDAAEVREKAKGLIARLNGTMAIMHNARPVSCGGIRQVDEDGRSHITIFAEVVDFSMGRCVVRATATILGPDGKPLPPPPPQPSAAQEWNYLATLSDDVADLLEQRGRAKGWYEIYKTIEIAEGIVGGKHKLRKLLGASGDDFINLRQTANFFRHARAPRPKILTDLSDANSLLNFLVRVVLDRVLELNPIDRSAIRSN